MTTPALELLATPLKPLSRHFHVWRDAFGIEAFVETGTHMGHTAASAAEVFDEVHTIELSRSLFEQARTRWSRHENLTFHHGDSITVLPSVIEATRGRRTLFWLDAHFSGFSEAGGVMTARGDGNCPTLTELEILRTAGLEDSVLLIDDLRQFIAPESDHEHDAIHTGYPQLPDIVEAVHRIGGHRFHVIGDIGLAHPATDAVRPSAAVRAMTASRLHDGDPASFADVITTERALVSLDAAERRLLGQLVREFARTSHSGRIRLGAHYLLWEGLALIGERKFAEALQTMTMARQCGIRDGRVEMHLQRLEADLATGSFEQA